MLGKHYLISLVGNKKKAQRKLKALQLGQCKAGASREGSWDVMHHQMPDCNFSAESAHLKSAFPRSLETCASGKWATCQYLEIRPRAKQLKSVALLQDRQEVKLTQEKHRETARDMSGRMVALSPGLHNRLTWGALKNRSPGSMPDHS